jgi:hypothetical protein
MDHLKEYDLFGEVPKQDVGIIKGKYQQAPFTLLSSRDGDWQERKRQWKRLGIESEVGRDAKAFNIGDWQEKSGDGCARSVTDTSVFDPVLCELMYQWFCPDGGQIIDPFAGGSVRGIVAATLGYEYWGCDIRAEQVESNQIQADTICSGIMPQWVVGDAINALDISPQSDLLFSCPPYGDLEIYSDMPGDISNMEYSAFMGAYSAIIKKAVGRMKNDSFACFVVGEFRDKSGIYRGFVPDTINAFISAGVGLYNEAILVTPTGSLPVRISAQFDNSRKMGKTHQNILVFVKGDPKKAAAKINAGAECLN